ncbi:hypothetical protein FRC17_006204, partial [Serendipita sp. 399]
MSGSFDEAQYRLNHRNLSLSTLQTKLKEIEQRSSNNPSRSSRPTFLSNLFSSVGVAKAPKGDPSPLSDTDQRKKWILNDIIQQRLENEEKGRELQQQTGSKSEINTPVRQSQVVSPTLATSTGIPRPFITRVPQGGKLAEFVGDHRSPSQSQGVSTIATSQPISPVLKMILYNPEDDDGTLVKNSSDTSHSRIPKGEKPSMLNPSVIAGSTTSPPIHHRNTSPRSPPTQNPSDSPSATEISVREQFRDASLDALYTERARLKQWIASSYAASGVERSILRRMGHWLERSREEVRLEVVEKMIDETMEVDDERFRSELREMAPPNRKVVLERLDARLEPLKEMMASS